MKTQISSIPPEKSERSRNPKRVARLAALFAAVLLAASSAVLHAQSVSFAGAQITVPTSGLYEPLGVGVDGKGDVFISDPANRRVVEVPWTGSGFGAQVTVPASGLQNPVDVAVDQVGNVFIPDYANNQVVEVPWTGNGFGAQVTVPASGLQKPDSVAVDASGNLFILDAGNNRVVELAWTGNSYGAQITVPTSGLSNPTGMTVDGKGNIFVADFGNNRVVEVPWTGSSYGAQIAVPAAGLYRPDDVAVDGKGDIFVADFENNRVVEVPWTGSDYGALITVPTSGLNSPSNVVVDGTGNVFISDANHVVELQQMQSVNFGTANVCSSSQTTPTPCSQTIPLTFTITASGTLGTPNVLTQGAPNLDFKLASGSTCTGAVTAGSTCTVNVTFAPIAPGQRTGAVQITDNSGNVLATTLIYGQGQGPVVVFSPGTQTTVVSGLKQPTGITLDEAGNLYILNQAAPSIIKISAGSGIQTTLTTGLPDFVLNDATSLAVDGAGNLFITSTTIYEVTPTGVKENLFALGQIQPGGVAVDGAGNLYVSDRFDNTLIKLSPTGARTTLATGLSGPYGVALDQAGNVLIADQGNNRVVEVPAGGGSQITVGSGLSYPEAVAVDGAGDIYIADTGNNRIVEVPAGGGSQITVASVGDFPWGVAVDAAGNVFISDLALDIVQEVQRSTPPALSFASIPVGQSSDPQSLTIQNIGNQPLTAATPGLSIGANFEQVAGSGTPEDCTSGFSIAPGASCNLSISFAPTSGGSIQSSAVLTDNALNANPAMQSITLTGTGIAAPTLTFNPIPTQTYGAAPFAVSATSTSTSAITYSVVSGPATISGNTVTITGAGTVTLQASQRSTPDYAAGSVQTTFAVNPAVLTVTAPTVTQSYGTAIPAFIYAVTGFVNGDTASVVSGTATLGTTATSTSAPGIYPISFSAESLTAANYTFNYFSGSLVIVKASQTITFNPLPNVTYGSGPITLTATSNSNLSITYSVTGPATVSGSTLTITGAGTVKVTALQLGNADYSGATPVQQSFTVNPAVLTVTPSPNNLSQPYGTAIPAFTYAVNGFVNGETVSVVSGTATASTTATSTSDPGSYPISFQTESLTAANYTFNYLPGTLTITQASQTITFGVLPSVTYGVGPVTLSATSSAGLPVSYSVTGPATLNDSTLTVTGVGTVRVIATQAGNTDYQKAPAMLEGFIVSPAVLTVTPSPNNLSQPYGTAIPAFTYAVNGFVNGETVSVVSGTATASTTATSTSDPGSYPISFQTESLAAANYTFNYLPGTLFITQASQTITFGALPNVTYGVGPITLAATSNSNQPIAYSVTGPATLNGSILTITGAGQVTVTASQAASTDYKAATAVQQSFTVNPATPTLNFAAIANQTYGAAPFAVSATSNSTGAITYSVVSGPATISGNTVTLTGVGTVTLQASVAAAGNYAATTATASFAVSAATPTLSFAAIPNQTYGAAPFAVSAASNSSGAITYSVVSGPATISGNTVTLTGVGTVTLQASVAAAGNYAATTATTSFAVSAATPTLSFAAIPNQTYGAAPFAVSATSNSTGAITYSVVNGPATISGNTVTLTGVGTVTLQASVAAAGNYAATTATTSFAVSAATPTLNFAAIANQTYGAAPFAVSATSNSTGAITYSVVSGPATISGSTVTLTGVGTVTLKASLAASGNYTAATATTSFAVNPASQTITFNPISSQPQGTQLTLSASASSGLAVTFTSQTTGICTVSGTTVTLTTAGTCTIKASQAGNANYAAATPVSQSFTVSAAAANFTITPIPGNETIKRGVLAAYILQLNAGKGFSGNVTLSCSGGPTGANCADFPMTLKLKSNEVAFAVSGILFPKNTTPGTYTITFTGVSGSTTESATATFTVTQ